VAYATLRGHLSNSWALLTNNNNDDNQGRFKGGGAQGERPPRKNSVPPCAPPPMKFMIKHNLPLVRGGSLCHYRSVPPSCNYGHPTDSLRSNVNPRTATDDNRPTSLLTIIVSWLVAPIAAFATHKMKKNIFGVGYA